LLARPPELSISIADDMGAALLASWPWDSLGFYKVRTNTTPSS